MASTILGQQVQHVPQQQGQQIVCSCGKVLQDFRAGMAHLKQVGIVRGV